MFFCLLLVGVHGFAYVSHSVHYVTCSQDVTGPLPTSGHEHRLCLQYDFWRQANIGLAHRASVYYKVVEMQYFKWSLVVWTEPQNFMLSLLEHISSLLSTSNSNRQWTNPAAATVTKNENLLTSCICSISPLTVEIKGNFLLVFNLLLCWMVINIHNPYNNVQTKPTANGSNTMLLMSAC